MRALIPGGVRRRGRAEETKSSPLLRSAVVRLVVDSFRTAPKTFTAAVAVALLAGVFPLVVAIQSGRVVELTVEAAGRGGATVSTTEGIRAAALLAALYLGSQALLGVRTALGEAAGRELSGVSLTRASAAASRPATVDHLADSKVVALIARTRGLGSIEVLPGDGTTSLVNKLAAWSGNAAAAVFLGSLRWWLGLAAVALFVSSYVVIVRGYRDIVLGSRDETGALRRTAYLRDVVVTSPAAKEIRVFGLTDLFLGRFRESWHVTSRELAKERYRTEWQSFVVSATVALAYVAVFGVLGADAAAGRISVAQIAAAVLAIGVLTNGILPGRDDLNVGWGAASLAAVRELEKSVGMAAVPKPSRRRGAGPPRIACRGVSYAYPNGQRVLDDLHVEVRAGESLAIVGANGAGKTTLARILAGLSVPSAGTLEVDGHHLMIEDLSEWQQQVAVLFQDFVRFEATLRDNVVFGAPRHADDAEGLDQACRDAGLGALIEAFPEGVETLISPNSEGGVDLSGGQWQRVALARALFSVWHGAHFLILDEPAASLDVSAEVELYERVLDIADGITTVVVSHRLAAVRHADRILVLDAGRVIEEGSHGALMGRGGTYAEMFRLQARRFETEVPE